MKIEKPPRLAIIGCGATVEFTLIAALRRIRWLPSVLIDISPKRIDLVARSMGRHTRVVRSSDWNLVAGEFDAALISLPRSLRGLTGISLLKKGKHLILEEPPARLDEYEEILSAAAQSGVTASVALPRRHLLLSRWTKALLKAETLGEIKGFVAHEGVPPNSDILSGFLPEFQSTRNSLLSAKANSLDLLLWWFGDFGSAEYYDDSEGGLEAESIIDCRLASGGRGTIEFSRTRKMSNSVRIEGERGFLEVHLWKNIIFAGSPNALAFSHEGVQGHEMKAQFAIDLIAAELDDFKKNISNGVKLGTSRYDGARSMKLINQCLAARRQMTPPWESALIQTSDDDCDAQIFLCPRYVTRQYTFAK